MKNVQVKFLDKNNSSRSIELSRCEDCIVFRVESEIKDFDIEINLETAKLLANILNEML